MNNFNIFNTFKNHILKFEYLTVPKVPFPINYSVIKLYYSFLDSSS